MSNSTEQIFRVLYKMKKTNLFNNQQYISSKHFYTFKIDFIFKKQYFFFSAKVKLHFYET